MEMEMELETSVTTASVYIMQIKRTATEMGSVMCATTARMMSILIRKTPTTMELAMPVKKEAAFPRT
jgi:hypothetical protein